MSDDGQHDTGATARAWTDVIRRVPGTREAMADLFKAGEAYPGDHALARGTLRHLGVLVADKGRF